MLFFKVRTGNLKLAETELVFFTKEVGYGSWIFLLQKRLLNFFVNEMSKPSRLLCCKKLFTSQSWGDFALQATSVFENLGQKGGACNASTAVFYKIA